MSRRSHVSRTAVGSSPMPTALIRWASCSDIDALMGVPSRRTLQQRRLCRSRSPLAAFRRINDRLQERKVLAILVGEDVFPLDGVGARQPVGCPFPVAQLELALAEAQVEKRIADSARAMHG